MAPKVKLAYSIGTLVICKHNSVPYDAKIIDIKDPDGADPVYVVHYAGWNSRYDEDVPHSKVSTKMVEATDDEIVKAKKVRSAMIPSTNKKKKSRLENMTDDELRKSENGSRGSSPSASSFKSKSLKRKATDSPSVGGAEKSTVEANISLPKELRQILVDDCDLISKNYLVNLPAAHTVDSIIKDYSDSLGLSEDEMSHVSEMYVEYEETNTSTNSVQLASSALAISDYFNILITYQLMYKFERPQYQELMEKDKASGEKPKKMRRSAAAADLPEEELRPSKYYGMPHLLRLLSRMPTILKLSNWSDHLLTGIVRSVHDFIVWLSKNRETYFVVARDYKSASTEYFRQSHQS